MVMVRMGTVTTTRRMDARNAGTRLTGTIMTTRNRSGPAMRASVWTSAGPSMSEAGGAAAISASPDPLMLARMLQFGDSVLPVGGFAFSGGLEAAVQKGIVHDAATLREFTLTVLEQAAHGDAVAVAWGVRAARLRHGGGHAGDAAVPEALSRLTEIDHEVFSRKPNEETRLMTVRMGKKLAEMSVHAAEAPLMRAWLDLIRDERTPGVYPVTLALLFGELGLEPEQALMVHQYATAMTILNAALRLLRVTHLDTQAILFGLGPELAGQCRLAADLPLARMAAYAPLIDILAAVHVRGRVRLFMN